MSSELVFWKEYLHPLLQKASDQGLSGEERVDFVRNRLLDPTATTLDQVRYFDQQVSQLLAHLDRPYTLGVSYLLQKGGGDDGYERFLYWLLFHPEYWPKQSPKKLSKDLDYLAKTLPKDFDPEQIEEMEAALTLAQEVWNARGQTSDVSKSNRSSDPARFAEVDTPTAEFDLDDEEAMRRHYPRLTRRLWGLPASIPKIPKNHLPALKNKHKFKNILDYLGVNMWNDPNVAGAAEILDYKGLSYFKCGRCLPGDYVAIQLDEDLYGFGRYKVVSLDVFAYTATSPEVDIAILDTQPVQFSAQLLYNMHPSDLLIIGHRDLELPERYNDLIPRFGIVPTYNDWAKIQPSFSTSKALKGEYFPYQARHNGNIRTTDWSEVLPLEPSEVYYPFGLLSSRIKSELIDGVKPEWADLQNWPHPDYMIPPFIFWRGFINPALSKTRRIPVAEQLTIIRQQLVSKERKPAWVWSFDWFVDRLISMGALFTPSLYELTYLVTGECTNESLEALSAWFILQGSETWALLVQNQSPQVIKYLAEYGELEEILQARGLLGLGEEVLATRSDREEQPFFAARPQRELHTNYHSDITKLKFDEAYLQQTYPELYQKFKKDIDQKHAG